MFAGRVIVLLLFLVASSHALAQGGFFGFTEGDVGAGDVAAAEQEARWRVALGLGMSVAPNFHGSDEYRVRPAPFVFAGYGRFFIGFGGIGYNFYRAPGWGMGAIVSPSFGRKQDADARLAGLGDVDRTVNAGVYGVAYTRQILARAIFYTDVGGEGHGSQMRFDLLRRFRVDEQTRLFAGPGFTWGSRQYTQTFFGVTDEQSLRSGLPAFEAGAGIHNVRLTAGANYRFAPNWNLISSLTASRITGKTGDSPIVETRAQYGAFLSAIYLFR